MSEPITIEIHAEASGEIRASRSKIWHAVADLAWRPNLRSCEPLDGVWPEETARVRTVMNKGEFEMSRTETVIRCIPEEQLLVKVEAPEWGSTAWLDHRIGHEVGGSRLTVSVIAVATFPEGAGPQSRSDYATMTQAALQETVALYRERIESETA